MNVLVVGNGGREHALAWKIGQSQRVERVFVAPGNAGTAEDAENVDIDAIGFRGLDHICQTERRRPDGRWPGSPAGGGDRRCFSGRRLACFRPSKAAAQLEGSKVFCKNLLRSADVPSADYHVFRDAASAKRFVTDRYPDEGQDVPLVVKADGLAAGKGVIVCHNREDALKPLSGFASHREFGDAGREIIIEERLDGQEASVLAITDGRTIVTLLRPKITNRPTTATRAPTRAAWEPTALPRWSDDKMLPWIEEHVLVPTVHAMKRSTQSVQRRPLRRIDGDAQGPKVLEYNVRFGDPECQPILMRLKTDLVDVLEATVDGRLEEIEPLQWDPRPAVCVVMASEGYPGNYEKGHPIRGLKRPANCQTSRSSMPARKTGRPSRHNGRPRARCHGHGQLDLGRQAASLHGRQMHPLAWCLVPQRYLRQSIEERVSSNANDVSTVYDLASPKEKSDEFVVLGMSQ